MRFIQRSAEKSVERGAHASKQEERAGHRAAPPTWSNQAMQQLLSARILQAKLAVSQPGDAYEREADRIADTVMRMAGSNALSIRAATSATVQRCPGGCPAGGCSHGEEEQIHLQRVTDAAPLVKSETPPQADSLRGGGQPFPASLRAFFEPRFGHDFSSVRVHADAQAAESARGVNALAYTIGRDIVFGSRQYAPMTNEGRRLIAHELVHVIQQGRSGKALSEVSAQNPLDDMTESDGDARVRSIERRTVKQRMIPGRIQRVSMPRILPLQFPCPNAVHVGQVLQFNHGNIPRDRREQFRTYLVGIARMDVGPGPEYTGHCMQEILRPGPNSCPEAVRRATMPCSKSDCLPINGGLGGRYPGGTINDGPTSFLDEHRTRNPASLLEGTGVNSCSMACEQRYLCDSLFGQPVAGIFRITRNLQAGTYRRRDGTTVHVTTGTVTKTEVPQAPARQVPNLPPRQFQEPPVRTLPEGMEAA